VFYYLLTVDCILWTSSILLAGGMCTFFNYFFFFTGQNLNLILVLILRFSLS
jgi:hypothetical protein